MLAPGTMAGNYVIEKMIGAGGGGLVYLARHKVLKRPAAIKVLRGILVGSPKMMARFVREASAVHLIAHPNIVDVYEFGELSDGRPFYVMEFIEGTTLSNLLVLRGRFSPAEALNVLEPACLALVAAHEAGVVHRDLKASNVLVAERHGQPVIKLADFGIAKLMHPEPGEAGLTAPGVVLGSVHIMSPEQILCEAIDARTDIYALGVLLFQLLTGSLPFSGARADIARMHLGSHRPRPSEHAPVPPAIDAVVLRAMDRNKDERHSSVAAFLNDLRRAVRGDEGVGSDLACTSDAVGIYLEARTRDDDMDDAMLDDLTNILDVCEGALRTEGFALPLQTSNALLAVKQLSSGPEMRRTECEGAREIAGRILEQLMSRESADARIHVNLGVHVDQAAFRESADGVEVADGAILQVEDWAPRDDHEGLFLSEAFQRVI